ncbi:hypothetical protein Q7C36_002172 [Tachysurus vachellii]|uniref:Uncharacterized protein n=1 Tax=Tachysurus vachellii TaxID=175792 RepID=A0AA88NVP5_TACVA|nr:hypothetical protein Q7C36_002172 [Tachysurus vachellii]
MCVTSLPLFAILLAVISHSFGSPVAHEYRRDTGVVLMRADNPDPGYAVGWRLLGRFIWRRNAKLKPDGGKSSGWENVLCRLSDLERGMGAYSISSMLPHLICA